jgi:hypothetical protein
MQPFFSSGGGVGATVEAAPCAFGFGAGGRRKVAGGPCRWAGPVGRPRPSGKGRENRPVKKKEKLGRKARWAESDRENSFPNKI